METRSSRQRYEHLVFAALALLVTTLIGVLLHAGLQPQLVA
jgi:hypothetical protein